MLVAKVPFVPELNTTTYLLFI